MKRIGITGGAGTGKSWLAAKLRAADFFVWDADDENKILWEKKEFQSELTQKMQEYGGLVLTDLTREKFANLIFSNQNLKNEVEKIIWPKLKMKWFEKESQAKMAGESVIFLVAPLLIEANWENLVDEVWVIETTDKQRQSRLIKRGWDEQQIRERVFGQASPAELAAKADERLFNYQDDELLWEQTKKLLKQRKISCLNE